MRDARDAGDLSDRRDAGEMQQISQFSPEMQQISQIGEMQERCSRSLSSLQRCSRSLRHAANFAEIRERSAAQTKRSISALLCRAERFAEIVPAKQKADG
jgi:hypothetical protein